MPPSGQAGPGAATTAAPAAPPKAAAFLPWLRRTRLRDQATEGARVSPTRLSHSVLALNQVRGPWGHSLFSGQSGDQLLLGQGLQRPMVRGQRGSLCFQYPQTLPQGPPKLKCWGR